MSKETIDSDNIDYFLISYEWQRVIKSSEYLKNGLALIFVKSNSIEVYNISSGKKICTGRIDSAKDLFLLLSENKIL